MGSLKVAEEIRRGQMDATREGLNPLLLALTVK